MDLTKIDIQMEETEMLKNNKTWLLIIKELRPKQWTKNLLVFAAILFSLDKATMSMFYKSILGFILFSFISGCVYILNDFIDREADRQHPEKKNRPMASGALNPHFAMSFAAILLFTSIWFSFHLNILFGFILILYFFINAAYSLKLKYIVIMDVMAIASGFVLRAIGGGIVIGVHFTPWFLLCTMLLALFLAISKRRHELFLLQNNMGKHREVLKFYSPELLNQFNSIVATSTIISYSLYTFTSGRTIQLMWTIPLVIYGIFRYLYLIHMEEKGGRPEKILLEDKHILLTVLLFAVSVAIILTVF